MTNIFVFALVAHGFLLLAHGDEASVTEPVDSSPGACSTLKKKRKCRKVPGCQWVKVGKKQRTCIDAAGLDMLLPTLIVDTPTLDLGATAECVVPLKNDVATYSWTHNGCLLGWIPDGLNDRMKFGTCANNRLNACPWDKRDYSYGAYSIKSPKHCNVNKIWFKAAATGEGWQNVSSDVNSPHWVGVKLVLNKDETKVMKSWSKPADNKDEFYEYNVVFDGIPANHCYRLIAQVTGVAGHVQLSEVNIRMYDPPKMLHDMDMVMQDWQTMDILTGATAFSSVKGDLVGSSSQKSGIGSDGKYYGSKITWTLGASYIVPTVKEATVVSNVYMMVGDNAKCNGRDKRVGYWNVEGGDGAKAGQFSSKKGAAFCLEKKPCSTGNRVVTKVEMIAFPEKEPKIIYPDPENCEKIGQWDPLRFAFSFTSGTYSTWTTIIYQCKADCKKKTCAQVKFVTMEPQGTPSMSSNPDASSIHFNGGIDQCGAINGLKKSQVVQSGDTETSTTSYTLDKEMSRNFKTTIDDTVSVWASSGFNAFGSKIGMCMEHSLEVSTAFGFSKTVDKTTQDLHSSTVTANVKETVTAEVDGGKFLKIVNEGTRLSYSTKFKAVAQCIDADGQVLETQPVTGTFKGTSHIFVGQTLVYEDAKFCNLPLSWNCVVKDWDQARRRLLGGETGERLLGDDGIFRRRLQC